MRTTHRRRCAGADERGSALLVVLLLILIMSALAAALTVSGQTETLVTRNHETIAQARAAAEAGVNHAVQVLVDYLQTIDPANIPNTLDTLLTDTTAIAGDITFDVVTDVPGDDDAQVTYTVSLMDDDNDDRGFVPNLNGDADPTNDEDGIETTDLNQTIVVRAVGRARGANTVTLEALLAPLELGAIVTDGDLAVTGNVVVEGGDEAHVHSNGDMVVAGSVSTENGGDVTASGSYVGPEGGSGGQPRKPLPNIRAEDYKNRAEYILADTGLILCNKAGGCGVVPTGGVVCDPGMNGRGCRDTYGWEFDDPGWSATNAGTKLDGAFYVEGEARISANHAAWLLTVIAEGSIDLSGSPELTAYTNQLLFVTDADLDISGGVTTSISAQGQMLVHEQVSFSGNVTLGGQVIVEDAPSMDPLVDVNRISGSVVINYSGGLGTNLFFVTGWREVR